jgi:anti-sigma regulatory factor (Ser/Thr protein kinase)
MIEIALHILDIVQNSIAAHAKNIEVKISEDVEKDILEIIISDDGKGIDSKLLKKVIDPFYTSRTTRKVGLGLSLYKQSVEQTEGSFKIESEVGKGTIVTAIYKLSHIDRPPLGDIAGTISLLVSANPKIDFKYVYYLGKNEYEFDTKQIKQTLEDVPISNPEVQKFIKEMIEENINNLII